MTKPTLSPLRLWQLSFGFMGIQFGWGLQMANMSPIYEMLGAKESELSLLWIAAPLTGRPSPRRDRWSRAQAGG